MTWSRSKPRSQSSQLRYHQPGMWSFSSSSKLKEYTCNGTGCASAENHETDPRATRAWILLSLREDGASSVITPALRISHTPAQHEFMLANPMRHQPWSRAIPVIDLTELSPPRYSPRVSPSFVVCWSCLLFVWVTH